MIYSCINRKDESSQTECNSDNCDSEGKQEEIIRNGHGGDGESIPNDNIHTTDRKRSPQSPKGSSQSSKGR